MIFWQLTSTSNYQKRASETNLQILDAELYVQLFLKVTKVSSASSAQKIFSTALLSSDIEQNLGEILQS